MNFSNYNFFYINGCSHIEGGGLEEPNLKINSVLPFYQKNYSVSWNSRADVNVGKRLSEILNINCINESMCGGGPERVVRMTYDFIYKNWDKKNQYFIILEKPDSSRFELFYQNEYYIGNTMPIPENKSSHFLFATRNYYDKDKYNKDKSVQELFKNYHNNFFNHTEKIKSNDFAFAGLYSFCKRNNIKIFLMMKNDFYFNENYDSSDIIKFQDEEMSDIHSFCKKNKLTIKDETNGFHDDFHPGFFGHIEYAKKLAKFLGWQGEYPNFPEYQFLKKIKL